MRKIACLLAICFVLLAGCESSEQQAAKLKARQEAAAEADAKLKAKIESIKNKKITTIRVNTDSVDFVTDDGLIFTVSSETYRYENSTIYSRVRIK